MSQPSVDQANNALELLARIAEAVRGEQDVVLKEETEDGKQIVTIEFQEKQPKKRPEVEMVTLKTPSGDLSLNPEDPLAQAKLALDQVSAGLEELRDLKI